MTTFVLRLEVDDIGEVTGIVERVRSGEKQRFHGYAMLGEVIRCMVASDRCRSVQKEE
jgi:hypothetical protein